MALACQKNSYLKELKTKVKSCTPAELKVVQDGKKATLKGFEVILEDTVLFPEGGGQPDDRGTINNIPVQRITRRAADAINFVTEEIPVGTDVDLVVDWTRRFDNMQQHSGQHLITALAEGMFGFRTNTWNLGEKTSFIELDTPTMTAEQMSELETALNEKIRQAIAVTPILYHDKNDPELLKARCRGLPDDHVGPVRVLRIEGIDECLCCGTHVHSTSDLQLIKLLSVEKGKRKDTVSLNFVCGGRVLAYLGRAYEVEKSLNNLLRGPLEQHYELAEKAVKGFKGSSKTIQNLLRDIAVLEAEKLRLQADNGTHFIYHRREGDIDFLNALVKEINDESKVCLLTAGEDKGPGFVMMTGPEDIVKELGPKVMELLEGKGGYTRGRYQGKANKLANREKAGQLVIQHVTNNQKTES